MNNIGQWTCPNCKAAAISPFCPTCGEDARHTSEPTLRTLFGHLLEAFTNVDSRLLRSFRFLLASPGALTNAYMKGQRKPYLGPVALFLIVNVLFFAMESLTGGKVFTTPLASHLRTQPWSDAVQGMIANRLQARHTTLAAYEPVFDQAVALKARSLIIFMALVFSMAPAIAFLRSGRALVTHLVFSLHFYAYVLLLLCIATAIPNISAFLGGPGHESAGVDHLITLDHVITIGLLIAFSVYLYFASRSVYGARGWVLVLKTAALTVAVAAVVLGYRFALLLITLYST